MFADCSPDTSRACYGRLQTGDPVVRLRSWLLPVILAIFTLGGSAPVCSGSQPAIDFRRDILPLLSDNCFTCHGPDGAQRKADLRLDLEAEATRPLGPDKKPAILRGNSRESLLIHRITSTDPDTVMPPPETNRQLTPDQKEKLRQWIDLGAPWSGHWAFDPPVKPPLPELDDFHHLVRNPIDAFILSRLEKEELAPSPIAHRIALIRRATLDLTGLPPTPGEVDAFLKDPSKHAFETVVRRLLESPRFGERMAWDWLDAARYADSNGYQGDGERTMWPWRDWVVQAFNQNLPHDQFIEWQLAGDLLPQATFDQKLATGFCRNHMINGEGGRIAEENRVDYVMDMMETVGTVWMGMTFNCCRCHDHKYDPLSQKDYYRFFGFFNQTPVGGGGGSAQTAPILAVPNEEQTLTLKEFDTTIHTRQSELAPIEKASFENEPAPSDLEEKIQKILQKAIADRSVGDMKELEKVFKDKRPKYLEQVRKLREAREGRDRFYGRLPKVMVMEDRENPRKNFMLDRGLYNKRGEEVGADVPEVLPPLPPEAPRNRLGLARWLTSPDHPLTARVVVNRFWQIFFGTGLIKTPDNLGIQGEFPVHPELLDWLAVEFQDSGWDVKALCYLIMTSHTYQQTSRVTPESLAADPENRLLSRGSRFRLPSWMIRDQALAAGGLLVDDLGGPPVFPYQPEGVWKEATFGKKNYNRDKGAPLFRRSLYVFWRRIVGPTMFFDTSPRQTCSVKVPLTNTPLHALITLNDITYVEAARGLADRVLRESGDSPRERIDLAFRLVLGRSPTTREADRLHQGWQRLHSEFKKDPGQANAFLQVGETRQATGHNPVELAAYAALGTTILNLDEALTRE